MFVRGDRVSTFWKRNGPPRSLAGEEGRSLVSMEAPVLMVGSDPVEVERRLCSGELLARAVAGWARGDMPGAGGCMALVCFIRAGLGAAYAGSRTCCWCCRACCAAPMLPR